MANDARIPGELKAYCSRSRANREESRESPRAASRMNAPPPLTFINVFTVDPAKQDELVDLLARATEASVRQAPGFLSARLHRSLDGTKVTMYAQWQSLEAYQAMREDPGSLPYLERALTIATFEPGVYEVVQTFLPTGATGQRNC